MTTIVLGLDGANWPLIEPWIDDGTLPNIDRLRENGLWGVSESVLPPVTCPNWKCYASSRSPGAHDVYWWDTIDKTTFEVEMPDSRSFSAPELWDYLDDAGYTVGVMNLPMSYPPRPVDGFVIAGGPQTEESGYTYPESLQTELERRDGYRVHPESMVSADGHRGVEETLTLIQTRFETAERLLSERDLDFFHLTIFYNNVLQHHFWNGEPVKRAWKIIDEHVGRLLDEAETLVLMSDHGCTEIETVFYVNEWLEREGYLSLDSSLADYLMRIGVTQERVGTYVSRLGFKDVVDEFVPDWLVRRFPHDDGIKHQGKFAKVDFEESVAIGSGQGLVYLLEPPSSPRYESVRDEIVEGLSKVTTPKGTSVATAIHRGEELYPDGDPKYRPDIVFQQRAGVHAYGAVGYGQVMDEPQHWRAENVPAGLFLAFGERVAAGRLDPISILDIAPTVLYAMGESIPRDFEGDPVEAAHVARGEPTYREPLPPRGAESGPTETVRTRLADIGYLE
ncbi:MAG: alkaline phosphatase family protein [Haloplanus sp.]